MTSLSGALGQTAINLIYTIKHPQCRYPTLSVKTNRIIYRDYTYTSHVYSSIPDELYLHQNFTYPVCSLSAKPMDSPQHSPDKCWWWRTYINSTATLGWGDDDDPTTRPESLLFRHRGPYTGAGNGFSICCLFASLLLTWRILYNQREGIISNTLKHTHTLISFPLGKWSFWRLRVTPQVHPSLFLADGVRRFWAGRIWASIVKFYQRHPQSTPHPSHKKHPSSMHYDIFMRNTNICLTWPALGPLRWTQLSRRLIYMLFVCKTFHTYPLYVCEGNIWYI